MMRISRVKRISCQAYTSALVQYCKTFGPAAAAALAFLSYNAAALPARDEDKSTSIARLTRHEMIAR